MTSEQTAELGADRAHDESAREICEEMTTDEIDVWMSLSGQDRAEIIENYEAGIFSLMEAIDTIKGEI